MHNRRLLRSIHPVDIESIVTRRPFTNGLLELSTLPAVARIDSSYRVLTDIICILLFSRPALSYYIIHSIYYGYNTLCTIHQCPVNNKFLRATRAEGRVRRNDRLRRCDNVDIVFFFFYNRPPLILYSMK